MDRFTRWPIAVPIKDITAESVIDAFAHGWVASFGVPSSITTDRGSQFSSAIWSQLMSTWSIKTHQTTPYHPAANGLVERFHRRLKESIIALSEQQPVNWFWHLPCALLSIRTTLKPDLGASPADLVYGEGLSVPGTLLPSRHVDDNSDTRRQVLDHLRLEVARLQPTSTSAHRSPRIHIPDSLAHASHVFVLRGGFQPALTSPYMGPFRVVSRGNDSYRIALPGRGIDSVNVSRLKPAIVADDDDADGVHPETPPSPPPPGRRPGVRTRVPDATDRVTRRTVRFQEDPQLPSTSRQAAVEPQLPVEEDIQIDDEIRPDDNDVEGNEPFLPEDPPQPPQPPPQPSQAPRQTRFFTRPEDRQFSRRRPQTSYGNVLNAILQRLSPVETSFTPPADP